MIPPTGRLKGKKRDFTEIVHDMRHIVCSVIRQRPMPGGHGARALGTGFFVARDVFITCDHVMNNPGDPHQAGDSYMLVTNLTGAAGKVYNLPTPQVGTDIHLFPNLDLAVIRVTTTPQDQPYAALDYGEVPEGLDIGVVGFPIPELKVINGNLRFDGLVYRAGRGHVSGRYTADLPGALKGVPVVEVNFLFVPGNSGGPVFSAENGRVLGFVHGYRSVKIKESVVQAKMIQQLPLNISDQYIEDLNAIYSLAFKLDFIRTAIEGFGATL